MAATSLGQNKQAAARCGLPLAEWQRRRAAGQARCYVCKEWKPTGEFAGDKTRPNGRASICKLCGNLRSTASRYGLTLAELRALPGADGACPICESDGRKMHVDHDHETGKVRGFLCTRCNVGLGQFGDSIEMLARASAYLEHHND